MATATVRFARLSTKASRVSFCIGWQTEVLLHAAVLELLWHPQFDVLVELASVDTAVPALSLSYYLPGGFERIWPVSAGVKGHLGAVDGSEDSIG